MTKDPAFLLYFRDFLVSTAFMSNAQVGAYIRGLCHQADKGHLPEEQLQQIAAEDWSVIAPKFHTDSEGKKFNKRLDIVLKRRIEFSNSRRRNRLGVRLVKNTSERLEKHMGNGNGSGNKQTKKRGSGGEKVIGKIDGQNILYGFWETVVASIGGNKYEAAKCLYRAKGKKNISAWIIAGFRDGYITNPCYDEEHNTRAVQDFIDSVLERVAEVEST